MDGLLLLPTGQFSEATVSPGARITHAENL